MCRRISRVLCRNFYKRFFFLKVAGPRVLDFCRGRHPSTVRRINADRIGPRRCLRRPGGCRGHRDQRFLVGDRPLKAHHPHRRRDRAKIATAIIGLVIGAIAFQFFRVQVLQSSDYKLQAESNRLRLLPIPAPRGTIYDRNGLIIVDNIPGYAVFVLAAPRDSMKVSLRRLQPILDLSDPRIEVLGCLLFPAGSGHHQ